ncbi:MULTISPECIES: helix-turn-helix transcriptional regulator [Roseobacteraceae]|uniref:helix-turn-helix domain-containing protein n=1 Tax=Roseobacteraceae TaxID=2854170 RepID=UPI00080AA4F3|nr:MULTISPECIES: helix-turn-helix transcriptional regulator [Roseobacteraceae]ANT59788.1 transcriptional regulator [Salipiger sp. CCB-MM3]MCA0993974.1 helix-turn-helix domain-containing protein [Alloyangia pacifica]NDV99731.1 helix-turn-helix transcriptional regulator [Salipiger sp. PrR002]NDW56671.1 helix-turn-helix transcriptional regulator [Salipiger sp. PrR004]
MEDENDWYGPEAATFGDRLAAAREAAGMEQETLAKRLGVRLKTLQGWENDLSEPRANRLQMLAGLLNVPMVWLITGEGDGVSAPGEEEPQISPDLDETLLELRTLRGEMRAAGERLGRLEKKLRKLLKEGA